MYEIYVITNAINGKKYVGQTCQGFEFRWLQHKSAARRGNDCYIYRAIRKHGVDSFSVEVVEYIDTLGQANEAEKKWIIQLQSLDSLHGYNSTHGGDGSMPTEYTRKKLSKTRKEQFLDPEFKARMTAANVGKNHTEQGKQNIATALAGNQYRKGIPHDEASKSKISAGLLKAIAEGRRASQKGKPTGRKGIKLGPKSEALKEKHRLGMLGRKQTPEHKENIRAAKEATRERKRLEKLQIVEVALEVAA